MSEDTNEANKHPETRQPAPTGKAEVFRARALSTILLWSLVALGLWWGNPIAIGALLSLFGIFACREYLAMLEAHDLIGRRFARGSLLVGACHLLAVAAIGVHTNAPAPAWIDSLTLCAATILGFSAVVLACPLHEKTLRGLATGLLGILYIPLLFAYATRTFFLAGQAGNEASGVALLLLLIAGTKSNDMGAYLVGTAIGRHKMIPRVSPGKTWEGFIGALVITTAITIAIVHVGSPYLGPLDLVDGLIIGILFSIFSVLGDLAASSIKRCVGTKDTGRSLPGIGGILDLIDSLLFTAPLLYLYLVLVTPR